VTGTLTYREPYELTSEAFAVVALVRGSARATESSIVASTIDRDVTAVPVDFELDLGGQTIDPDQTYTIQATIVDGENAWVTGKGVPVLTKGNPSNVAITLTYRPDLVKGAVSGQITGVGIQPSPTAYSMAVLVDPSTGESLGIEVRSVIDGIPVPFSIGYTITDISPTQDYVVTAEIGDGGATWRNAAGVPVITNGNPKSGVQVVVTPVSAAPSASPSPSPSPSASPIPVPLPDTGRAGDLLPWIVILVLLAAVVAFLVARGRNQDDELPPDGTETTAGDTPPAEPGAATEPDGAAAEAGEPAPAEPDAAPPAGPDPAAPR